MNDLIKCPRCGADQPIGSTGGICPRCAAGLLQATQTDIPGEGTGAFTPPTVTELAAKFPQLEILELIGRGGMGAVYKARQKELDRIVALKILPPDIGRDAAFAERFSREAKALARLNHPGIVTIHDFGRADGLYFFVMEFVDGMNLRELLNHQRISAREALAIVPQICDALQFAHDQGIVHRDIKPENLLLDRRGRVKVADFGLAKLIGPEHDPAASGDSPHQSTSLTEAGKVMGTPNYMSPEQVEHPGEVDHRADIYALGVVFYQMLTGELPDKQIQPPSRKVQIDVRLDEVVLRALEKQPDRRYQQASTMKTQVEMIAQGPAQPVAPVPPRFPSGVDYKSKSTLFGWPLVHVATGVDPATGRARIARGIIAIGGGAVGVVAFGGMAAGGFAVGGVSLGIVSFGGCSLGVLALGGLSVGLLMALGGLAVAPVAIGGQAVGIWALGAQALGVHKFQVAGQDPVAQNFFTTWAMALLAHLPAISSVLVTLMVLVTVLVPLWISWRRREGSSNAGPPPVPPTAVADWLALMDQGDYARSWETAAGYFQRVMAREEWIRLGQSIRTPLGRVLSRQLNSMQYKYLGTRMEVKYGSVFEFLPAAVETVTFQRESNGEWKSIGYLIRPAGFEESSGSSQTPEKASPSTRADAREISRHFTASEKRAFTKFSILFACWNSATFFLPFFCIWFLPLPVPLNWIVGSAVLLLGLAFYPLWWKHQAGMLSQTTWAQARRIGTESIRIVRFGSTGLMLQGGLYISVIGFIWWFTYQPDGVWQPWLSESSLIAPSAGGSACVTDVRQYGQTVWLLLNCDPLPRSAGLTPVLIGPLVELPETWPEGATNVDCLVTTAPHDLGKKIIFGTGNLIGKTNFTVGFVLPDEQAAAAAVKLIRRMDLNQPHGLDSPLFVVRRTLGKDASGKVMAQEIFASLQLQGSSTTNEAHTIALSFQKGRVVWTNQSGSQRSVATAKQMTIALGDGKWMTLDGTNIVVTTAKPSGWVPPQNQNSSTIPASALQFRLVVNDQDPNLPADTLTNFLDSSHFELLEVSREVLLNGTAVERVGLRYRPDGLPEIVIGFTEAGSRQFAALTSSNLNRRLALFFSRSPCLRPQYSFRHLVAKFEFSGELEPFGFTASNPGI